MQSILLIGEKTSTQDYLSDFFQKLQIGQFDIQTLENEKSIGIEEIRIIQKNLLLKPINGNIKAIVIDTNDAITIESQNALLKILEEPPNHTVIILIASKQELFLPTILSRCKIVNYQHNRAKNLSKDEIKEYTKLLGLIINAQIGEQLKYAQDFGKTKKEALLFLENMILSLREKMIEELTQKQHTDPQLHNSNLKTITALQKAYSSISTTNVSTRSIFEDLFFSLKQ